MDALAPGGRYRSRFLAPPAPGRRHLRPGGATCARAAPPAPGRHHLRPRGTIAYPPGTTPYTPGRRCLNADEHHRMPPGATAYPPGATRVDVCRRAGSG